MDAKCWQDEDTTLDQELVLGVGEYYCYVEIDWFNDEKFNNFVFRTYSDNEIELHAEDPEDHEFILEEVLKSCAKQKTQKKEYTDKGYPEVSRAFSLKDSKCEYGFLYYENNHPTVILREYVQFSDMKNLQSLSPYEPQGDLIEVEVDPGTSEIVVLKRQDRSCTFNCVYYTNFILPSDESANLIRTKGKKTKVEHKDEYSGEMKEYDINFYVLNDGSGYFWLFENCEPKAHFDATFEFKLENMEIEDDPKSTKWRIRLKAGQRVFKRLVMKDMTQSWGYKYAYSFKVRTKIYED